MSIATFHNPKFPDEIVGKTWNDTRNVIDIFKWMSDEDIHTELQKTQLPFTAVAENFANDFNIATLVRNANAFNIQEVSIVGHRRWDKRGAVGTYHYTNVVHHNDSHSFYSNIVEKGIPIIAIDNISGAVDLPKFEWPEGEICVVFGQEQIGVSNIALSYAQSCIAIPQRGSVRSLNVGTSSGIIIYDYCSKMGF